MFDAKAGNARRAWPDYAAVWRWHFYAGLFCLPFVCLLAITGSIYLFRPDIEAVLDRPYEALTVQGSPAAPSSEARAALSALPGSVFNKFQPPATPTGAGQVIIARDGHLFRLFIHPGTLKVMKIERDDHRIMELVFQLHGALLLGDRGSMLVELAASWAVVMILTGLYLWLPRGNWRAGGVLYPRLGQRGRLFWRDLHAVTGLWASLITLFMLLSGLPWATSWGNYLTWARSHWSVTAGQPNWPVGATNQTTGHVAASPILPADARASMPGMTAAEMAAMSPSTPAPKAMAGMTAAEMAAMAPPAGQVSPSADRSGADLQALDKLEPLVARLKVPRPVWILPPAHRGGDWTISSQIQTRPLRITYTVDPTTGRVTGVQTFAQQNIVDKIVNVAVSIHEGQLFGRLNQAILLLTACCLVIMTISAAVMWWLRRPAHQLGAPQARARPRFSILLAAAIAGLALLLPMFGLSLLIVLVVERTLLRRLPAARRWLGLNPSVV
jgi:uncharacterized iron-regulated membrane protein